MSSNLKSGYRSQTSESFVSSGKKFLSPFHKRVRSPDNIPKKGGKRSKRRKLNPSHFKPEMQHKRYGGQIDSAIWPKVDRINLVSPAQIQSMPNQPTTSIKSKKSGVSDSMGG